MSNFKRAAALFTSTFAVSTLSLVCDTTQSAEAANVGKLDNTCYSIISSGKFQYPFLDIYDQPWYGLKELNTQSQVDYTKANEISSTLPNHNFVAGYRPYAVVPRAEYSANGENYKTPPDDFSSAAIAIGELECPSEVLPGLGLGEALEDLDPTLRAQILMKLTASDQSTRRRKLGQIANALLLPKNVTAAGGLATGSTPASGW